MKDFNTALGALRRPRLLIRAARHGMSDYNRTRDLKRIARVEDLPPPESAVQQLMDMEADQERIRREGNAAYSVARHLDILIALMAEARQLLRGPAATI